MAKKKQTLLVFQHNISDRNLGIIKHTVTFRKISTCELLNQLFISEYPKCLSSRLFQKKKSNKFLVMSYGYCIECLFVNVLITYYRIKYLL
jgi:hypothetical protein